MKLEPYKILDFSGGIRNDISDYVKADNEFVKIINFDIDEQGRLKKRLGSQQFGTTGTGNIENSIYWEFQTGGSTPSAFQIISNTESTANLYKIIGTQLTVAVSIGDTTINVTSTGLFTASGTMEIDGDIITYTGTTGTKFTGCSGITSSHLIDSGVHQLVALTGTSVNGSAGVYFAVLNNLLFINGRVGSSTFNGTTMTAVADADEPNGLFATTYRQRIYLADSGAGGGVPVRIYRSEPADSTSWVATEYFDVEDNIGEVITGLKVLNDELLIFKRNSFFAYNEVNLKQRSTEYGAYNHKVIQEISGLVYSFCPAGIYVTNGVSVKLISNSVKDWIKDFYPIMDTTISRVVTNTFATVYKNKYFLYIGDVITPGTYNDVVLCYDTLNGKWTIYTGFTNFQHLKGLNAFRFANALQGKEGLFGGDDSGKYYRFFSKTYRESGGDVNFQTTGDIFENLISNTGSLISAENETKLYDFGYPGIYKQFNYLRILGEKIGFQIFYRVETEKGLGDWISLGTTKRRNHRFTFPSNTKGYRIAIKIRDIDKKIAVLNGIIFEDIELISEEI